MSSHPESKFIVVVVFQIHPVESGVNYFPNLVLISGCRYTLLSGVNYFPNLVLFSGCRFTLLSAVFVDLKYNKVKLPVDEVLRMVMIQLQVSC